MSWDFHAFSDYHGVFTAPQVLSHRDEDFFRGLRDLVELFILLEGTYM